MQSASARPNISRNAHYRSPPAQASSKQYTHTHTLPKSSRTRDDSDAGHPRPIDHHFRYFADMRGVPAFRENRRGVVLLYIRILRDLETILLKIILLHSGTAECIICTTIYSIETCSVLPTIARRERIYLFVFYRFFLYCCTGAVSIRVIRTAARVICNMAYV